MLMQREMYTANIWPRLF